MEIAIALFERVTALDAIGPYEVLRRLPRVDVRFVAAEAGPKRCDSGALALVADWTLAEVPNPDVVVVPGGAGDAGGRRSRACGVDPGRARVYPLDDLRLHGLAPARGRRCAPGV